MVIRRLRFIRPSIVELNEESGSISGRRTRGLQLIR